MYQLIGITIDFFAFNTITKIYVKSNENDFNYPFITLIVDINDLINLNLEASIKLVPMFKLIKNAMSQDYDKSCDIDFMWNTVQRNEIRWKIYYLLNCASNKLFKLMNWDSFKSSSQHLNLSLKSTGAITQNMGLSAISSTDTSANFLSGFISIPLRINKRNKDIFEELTYHKNRNISLGNLVLHSHSVPHINDIATFNNRLLSSNNTFIVRKILRSYLEFPFGNCSHYKPQTVHEFNASSHMQCYRRCLISFARKHIGCHPVFIDNFISELDLEPNEEYNKTNVCLYDKYLEFEEKRKTLQLNQKCVNLCPKDCLTVDYFYDIMETDSIIRNNYSYELLQNFKKLM